MNQLCVNDPQIVVKLKSSILPSRVNICTATFLILDDEHDAPVMMHNLADKIWRNFPFVICALVYIGALLQSAHCYIGASVQLLQLLQLVQWCSSGRIAKDG